MPKRPSPWAHQTDPFASGMSQYTQDQTAGNNTMPGGSPWGPLPSQMGQAGARPGFADLQQTARENDNLNTKYQAMTNNPNTDPNSKGILDKAWDATKNVGKWGLNTTFGKSIMWTMDQVDRPWNAVKGGLQEALKYNSDTYDQGQHKFFDTGELKAAGQGIAKGFTHDKRYELGSFLSGFAKDNLAPTGLDRAMNFSPGRFIQGVDQSKIGKDLLDYSQGKSGPQTDPNFSGFKNATIADILGFAADAKAMDRLTPIRVGRVVVPGASKQVVDDVATAAAKAAREAEVATLKKGVLRSTQSDASMRTALEALSLGTKDEIKALSRKELQAFMSDARGARTRAPKMPEMATASANPDAELRTMIDEMLLGKPSASPTTAAAAKAPGVTRETLNAQRNANADIVAKALGLDTSTTVPDMMKAIQGDPSAYRVLKTNVLGKEYVPFQGAQVAANKSIVGAAKSGLSHVPALENFLANFSNGVESTRTAGRIDMNNTVRQSKQGGKSIGGNLDERLAQELRKVKPTEQEQTALYYAINMGKSLDDPEFLQQLLTHKGIQFADPAATVKKLEPLRQWWKGEQQAFAATGDAVGHFKPVNTEYLPIFRTKPNSGGATTQAGQIGQEFGGLRSIQKNREVDVAKLLEQSGNITDDHFAKAVSHYGDVFGNLETRRHMLDQLVEKGVGSWKPQAGMVDIADVIKATGDGMEGKPFYLKEALKDPFAEQLFGYGGLKANSGLPGLFKKMGKVTEPWKATVTTFNPNHMIRNNIDDAVTNSLYDSGLPNAKKAGLGVTRETPVTTSVRDWVQNQHGQWEYSPGARNTMTLSSVEAKALADKMGVTMTQNDALAKFSGDSAIKRGLNKARNIVEGPNEAQRARNFTSNLRGFGDSQLAADATGRALVDYGGLTPFQRDVLKPLMPFSTFAMKNPAVALDKMLQNPENLGKLAMAQQRLDPNGDVQLPERYQGKPVLAWNDKQSNQTKVLDMGLSQADLGWLGNPGSIPDIVRRQFGPLGQVALGEMTGRDSFGREITKGMKLAGPIEKALGLAVKGPDGKLYVDSHSKFLLDSALSGINNNLAASGKMTDGDFSSFSPLKSTDTDATRRSVLLQKMALKNDALDKLRQMGFNIPTMQTLAPQSNDPFRRSVGR